MLVQGQPRQIVYEILFRKYSTQKKRAGGVAQVVKHLPEFKPQYSKKKKKKK
jgi:hypothetical protein